MDKLTGGTHNALTYTQQRYRFGGRYVIRITDGPNILAAQGARNHSVTLLQRMIASEHWVRIKQSPHNACSPDKWLKDKAWSGFKTLVPFVKADAGFMRKVTSTGSSAVANWSGTDDRTANLCIMGTLNMEVAPSYILLAHELIHADRITRGRLETQRCSSTYVIDQRQGNVRNDGTTHMVQQPTTFTSAQIVSAGTQIRLPGNRVISNANNVISNLNTGWLWMSGTMELAEEIATVGLSDDGGTIPLDPLAITENMIRAEHHEKKRLKYGGFTQRIN